ncbi:MAG: hypothetical protein ACQEQC_08350 [Elusimicrobiota bacterium]
MAKEISMNRFLKEGMPSFELPIKEERLAEYLGKIVSAASFIDTGGKRHTPLKCRKEECRGRLVVRRKPPGKIRWHCPGCKDSGIISGWEDSPWDYQRYKKDGPGDKIISLVKPQIVKLKLTPAEYDTLFNILIIDNTVESLLYKAEYEDNKIIIRAPYELFEELLGYVGSEINHDSSDEKKRILENIFCKIEDIL